MLDIKFIREKPRIVEENIAKRHDSEYIELLQKLIESDKEKRDLIQEVEKLRAKRNTVTQKIAELKSSGKDATVSMKEAASIPEKIKELEEKLQNLEDVCHIILMRLPNLLHESVPTGKDDTENVEIRRHGQTDFWFTPKNHAEIAEGLGMIDIERAAKVSGHGFYYLKGDLAFLEQALIHFALDTLRKRGFTIVSPPLMMKRKPYEGVTSLADFGEVLYKVDGEDLHLIATSEHPMAAMYMDETLDLKDLPIKLAGVSPCFRKEVGTHGKYTKGLFRVHNFNKVEQFVFSTPETSWEIHEQLQENSEYIYQQLGIPYRVVNVCTGDIGIIAAKKYDTEFLMSDGNYREIGSNSNCTDYQARRLNIKYRESEGKAPAGYVHTLNNTALATSRTLVAILENHQQEDGTIKIPDALVPYMHGQKTIERSQN